MNATEIAAALSVRAEDVCRRYLLRGRKQGRYWTVGDTNGAKGRSLFVRLALRTYLKMDRRHDQQAWRSARSHPSAHRWSIAVPRHGEGPRVPLIAAVHSRHWRRHRGRAALLARPQATRRGQPRPPAQSTLTCPRQGRAIRRVRHWRDPACRRGHRNRAVTGHRYPRNSCRGGSISGHPRRLRSTPRPRPVGHRPR